MTTGSHRHLVSSPPCRVECWRQTKYCVAGFEKAWNRRAIKIKHKTKTKWKQAPHIRFKVQTSTGPLSTSCFEQIPINAPAWLYTWYHEATDEPCEAFGKAVPPLLWTCSSGCRKWPCPGSPQHGCSLVGQLGKWGGQIQPAMGLQEWWALSYPQKWHLLPMR